MADYKLVSRPGLVVVLAVLLLLLFRQGGNFIDTPPAGQGADADIERLIQARAVRTWVEAAGSVSRILPDDREGSQHQRFILRLESGRTLLVAHNIDLARRVPVQVGESVRLRGRYEWNDKGGVIHWTHHDPDNREAGGWVEHNAVRYQ